MPLFLCNHLLEVKLPMVPRNPANGRPETCPLSLSGNRIANYCFRAEPGKDTLIFSLIYYRYCLSEQGRTARDSIAYNLGSNPFGEMIISYSSNNYAVWLSGPTDSST